VGVLRPTHVGVLVVAFAIATSVAERAPASAVQRFTFRLEAIELLTTKNDVAPGGQSKGDVIVRTNRLKNTFPWFGLDTGDIVGSDRLTLRFVDRRAAIADGVAKLPIGTIRVHGRVRVRAGVPEPIAVAGGTDTFAGATGTLKVLPLDAGRSTYEYRIVWP
jgi:hypothetical protein